MTPTSNTPFRLDSSFYRGVLQEEAVLQLDQELAFTDLTRKMALDCVNRPNIFRRKFAKAMMKLANVGVLTGQEGQIGPNCRRVNKPAGSNLKKWGHMKLRTVLQECVFDKEFQKSPLVYQFSSLGSLDEKWMAELAFSMSSGVSDDKTPLGLGEPLIIWPTVEDVRCSLEGYAAGNAIPGPQKNVEKEFLKKYWAKWKASHTGRCRAMPHIKTFTRYNGQNLAWLLLTSSNLSKAAWGALQKNNSQLMIRSYELGVLFLPSNIKRHGRGFSCIDDGNPSKDKGKLSEKSEAQRTKLVTLTWQGGRNADSSSEVIQLPVPYELPPQRYSSEDVPWSWDRRYSKKDVYGQVWPRHVQLYACQDF
ncbi:hypothetical protein L1049_009910 [Liquidambar formosana]|uniref:Plant heme peroxidase family profile domain-containing protein n=1 Tax=Liquidambar formosana TaxID=63359 RepID=A0AAP0NAG2_LIQFO